jgi:hypothetical protein
MSEFELIEIPLDQLNISPSMEDEFLKAKITKDIDACSDVEELREAAKKLLSLAVARQGAVRGLCNRLIQYETAALQNYAEKQIDEDQ